MSSGVLPQLAFLFSIAGLSVTLSGFSGLVAAFRRGDQWRPVDGYRLRQIPEAGLATALVVLVTIPLADTTRSGATAIQIAGGLALVFTILHIVALSARKHRHHFSQPKAGKITAGVVRLAIVVSSAVCIALGSSIAYEWLLVSLLARPMLAFVLVLSDVGANMTPSSSSASPSHNLPAWSQQNALGQQVSRLGESRRSRSARHNTGIRSRRV
jgi:hypothetical protein